MNIDPEWSEWVVRLRLGEDPASWVRFASLTETRKMNGVEPYLHPRRASASAIASIRSSDSCRRLSRPDPRIPPRRAVHAPTSVSPVFTPTPGLGSVPLRSFPSGVSRCPETGVGVPPFAFALPPCLSSPSPCSRARPGTDASSTPRVAGRLAPTAPAVPALGFNPRPLPGGRLLRLVSDTHLDPKTLLQPTPVQRAAPSDTVHDVHATRQIARVDMHRVVGVRPRRRQLAGTWTAQIDALVVDDAPHAQACTCPSA